MNPQDIPQRLTEAPSIRFVGTITVDISTVQFHTKEKMEEFLCELLESVNGSEFHLNAIPIIHHKEAYPIQ